MSFKIEEQTLLKSEINFAVNKNDFSIHFQLQLVSVTVLAFRTLLADEFCNSQIRALTLLLYVASHNAVVNFCMFFIFANVKIKAHIGTALPSVGVFFSFSHLSEPFFMEGEFVSLHK